MNKQEAAEKISKLLKLSESPNENEAFAALMKAQKLAMIYGVECKKINDERVCDEKRKSDYATSPKWYRQLLSVIAYNFNCEILTSNYSYSFIGLESDVKMAEISFRYALNSLKYLWKAFLEDYKKKLYFKRGKRYNAHIAKARTSYHSGFVSGLHKRYAENVEKNALVLCIPDAVAKYIDDKYPDIPYHKSRKGITEYNQEALRQGYLDGVASRTENMHTMIGTGGK